MKTGAFITFEGIDGCGKTTQIQLARSFLDKQENLVITTLEPGGTDIGIQIRKILLNQKNQSLVQESEMLLYLADRIQHLKEVILPALEKGNLVLCDRFHDSTLAYQGGGRGIDIDYLLELNNFATYELDPDITILIDISSIEAQNRVNINNPDRIENAGIEFQEEVRNLYLQLADRFPERFLKIDGHESIEVIHSTIWEKTINCINAKK